MYRRSLYSSLRGTALFLNITNVFIEYLVLIIRRYLYLGTLWYQHVPKYKESLELNINNYVPEYKEPFVLNIDNYVPKYKEPFVLNINNCVPKYKDTFVLNIHIKTFLILSDIMVPLSLNIMNVCIEY